MICISEKLYVLAKNDIKSINIYILIMFILVTRLISAYCVGFISKKNKVDMPETFEKDFAIVSTRKKVVFYIGDILSDKTIISKNIPIPIIDNCKSLITNVKIKSVPQSKYILNSGNDMILYGTYIFDVLQNIFNRIF
jgi:hypothetical protein